MGFWIRGERAERLTWSQRHEAANQFIAQHVQGKKQVTAWVIGLGGWKRNRESEQPIQRFFRDWEQRVARWTGHELTPTRPTEHVEVAQALKRGNVRQIEVNAIEVNPESLEMAKSQLPEEMMDHIVFHGPGPAGNAFKTFPRKRPDVVTAFNMPGYYSEEEQAQLAEHLADSLKPGGVILTNVLGQETFVERLAQRLTLNEIESNNVWKLPIVAFKKP